MENNQFLELIKSYQDTELELSEVEKQISLVVSELQTKQKELAAQSESMKEQIKTAMEENDIKKYENDYIAITYVAPQTRTLVDSKKLKDDFFDIYQQCLKTSNVKSSIRIKVKGEN